MFSTYNQNEFFSFEGFLLEMDKRRKIEQQIGQLALKNQTMVYFEKSGSKFFFLRNQVLFSLSILFHFRFVLFVMHLNLIKDCKKVLKKIAWTMNNAY